MMSRHRSVGSISPHPLPLREGQGEGAAVSAATTVKSQCAAGSASAAATVEAVQPEVKSSPVEETAPGEKTKANHQPPYAVILHNDNFNGFDYVVSVLRKVFNYDRAKAHQLTMAAHTSGRSIVWSGVREVAELKADQIRSCGPDPVAKANGALALRVTLEPLPG
jgi:ATP-dependent Clp protease adaptor protein ClpS